MSDVLDGRHLRALAHRDAVGVDSCMDGPAVLVGSVPVVVGYVVCGLFVQCSVG
jgi:hypothetical protein